ncbi:MAG: hypothetical protein HC822_22805 [Oscillochloris sp.]|nr:hypothetical protein [Oscillochloris sp.]
MDRILTILDTSGIQDYIFASNRMRENIGASYLVAEATETWLKEALSRIGALIDPLSDQGLEHIPQAPAELVYAGGGNAAILFRARTDAVNFVTAYSRTLIRNAPGLPIKVIHHAFSWDNDAFGGETGAFNTAMRQLRSTPPSWSPGALAGLSVTVACRSTGLPAVDFDPDETGRSVSALVLAQVRESVRKKADERLKTFLRRDPDDPNAPDPLDEYSFSRDFDDLGRSRDDVSYIAVIHADGNGIGKRFRDCITEHDQAGVGSRTCITKLRKLSNAVNAVGTTALRNTIQQRLLPALKEPHFRDFVHNLPQDDEGKPILPVRPLVYGGDDVTIVCDGRLGLTLATAFLEEFAQATETSPSEPATAGTEAKSAQTAETLPGGPATASAGIAIVKSHYPFSRAYELSAELTRSAKDYGKPKQAAHGEPQEAPKAALDWHIAISGISADLEQLRERDYAVPSIGGSLVLRPVLLEPDPTLPAARSWPFVRDVIETLKDGAEWRERRNKVIALREALRGGPDEVRRFRIRYGLEHIRLSNAPEDDVGWIDAPNESPRSRSLYFDAIELIDLYLAIPDQPVSQP